MHRDSKASSAGLFSQFQVRSTVCLMRCGEEAMPGFQPWPDPPLICDQLPVVLIPASNAQMNRLVQIFSNGVLWKGYELTMSYLL